MDEDGLPIVGSGVDLTKVCVVKLANISLGKNQQFNCIFSFYYLNIFLRTNFLLNCYLVVYFRAPADSFEK